MKFLVVDDSSADRYLLRSLLEGLGHQVEESSTTEGMLEQIAAGSYAAVFLDIVLPEQDGYKFLRTLRSNDSTAKQHVILCSSKKTSIEINYGIKRAGADNYLVKPVTAEALAEVLTKV